MRNRLGRIEKFVLLNLLEDEIQGNAPYKAASPRFDGIKYRRIAQRDRSLILYSLYCVKNRLFESNYSQVVKERIELVEFNRLQSTVTKATRKLEKKGYIGRASAGRGPEFTAGESPVRVGARVYTFFLTDDGRSIAKVLAGGIKPTRAKLSEILFAK